MIPILEPVDSRPDPWKEFVASEMEPCRTALEAQGTHVEDIAAGIALYCAGWGTAGMDSRWVDAMIGRALWSVGQEREARRYLSSRLEQESSLDTLLHVLSLGEVEPLLWTSIVRGVIRRGHWLSRGEVWLLDLARLEADAHALELTVLRMARALIGALAVVWMPRSGQGTLGLSLYADARTTSDLESLWMACCARALEGEQRQRGWAARPDILRLT